MIVPYPNEEMKIWRGWLPCKQTQDKCSSIAVGLRGAPENARSGGLEVGEGRKGHNKDCITWSGTLVGSFVKLKPQFPHLSELRHLPTTPVSRWLRTAPTGTSSWQDPPAWWRQKLCKVSQVGPKWLTQQRYRESQPFEDKQKLVPWHICMSGT